MVFISIYKISNSINNKLYIGQTIYSIQERFAEHKRPSNTNCYYLHNAFNKYGRENFKIELLTVVHTQEIADYWEDYFINYYDSIKNGYNLMTGGKGMGKRHSEESKKKVSEATKGEKNGFYGKTHTEESRMKMSKALKGRVSPRKGAKMTDEQIIYNRDIMNERLTTGWRANIKIDVETAALIREEYKIVKSQRKLAQKYGVGRATIKRILKNKRSIDKMEK